LNKKSADLSPVKTRPVRVAPCAAGETPGIIIMISIFSGLTNVIQSDKEINFNILFSPEVFFPLLALALMSLIANFIKKKYFKNKI
jgi:hypothetical protein